VALVMMLKRRLMSMQARRWANKPASPIAGIAPRLTIGHRWPGVGEPGRSAGNQKG